MSETVIYMLFIAFASALVGMLGIWLVTNGASAYTLLAVAIGSASLTVSVVASLMLIVPVMGGRR